MLTLSFRVEAEALLNVKRDVTRRNMDRDVVRVLVREGGKGPICQRDNVYEALVCEVA